MNFFTTIIFCSAFSFYAQAQSEYASQYDPNLVISSSAVETEAGIPSEKGLEDCCTHRANTLEPNNTNTRATAARITSKAQPKSKENR